MIPRPKMIPKLECKWLWTANDPRRGPQMIPAENEEWHGVITIMTIIYLVIYLFVYLFIYLSKKDNGASISL